MPHENGEESGLSAPHFVIVIDKFPLGNLHATPGLLASVPHADIQIALNRHASGDWGELDGEDIAANNRALAEGSRLLSSYLSAAGVKFWIITEWDRSSTTLLLPHEY